MTPPLTPESIGWASDWGACAICAAQVHPSSWGHHKEWHRTLEAPTEGLRRGALPDADVLMALDAAIEVLAKTPGRFYSAQVLTRVRSAWETGTAEDPRDYGLSADDLREVADRLYSVGDSRLRPMDDASARFGRIRSRLRGMADGIDDAHSPGGSTT